MPVDIVIVGSGMACTTTLTALFDQLSADNKRDKPLTITVIEKYNEYWKGIPFGSRSSVNSLNITCVKDFFTEEEERLLFIDWFKLHKHRLITHYKQQGGVKALEWLGDNEHAIAADMLDGIYLPRFMVGEYMYHKFCKLLNKLEEDDTIQLSLITGEAIDVNFVDGLYTVDIEQPNQFISSITAKKLVIATGAAPEKQLISDNSDQQFTYINSIYEPQMEANISNLQSVLNSTPDFANRNILIIGSNASCIELLYVISGSEKLKSVLNNITVLSPSGILPYHVSHEESAHKCIHLDELKFTGIYTLEELIEAASSDIKSDGDKISLPYVDKVISLTINLLHNLGDDARETFYSIYGLQLAKLFRRAGVDYKKASEVLLQSSHLCLLKGRFNSVNIEDGLAWLQYTNPSANTSQQYPVPFRAVINCTGPGTIADSSSRLIRNLISHNNCKVLSSGKGFKVNERFEAAPNLYVIGPLIGGNVNNIIKTWHLESVSRLMHLAPHLAKELVAV